METPARTIKSLRIIVLTAALAAGTLESLLSYQDEQSRFSEMASIAEAHLTYALQLKDDMAIIDWSKALEKQRSILAFQAKIDTKVAAEGGNQLACPSLSADGLSFDFPYRWIVHNSFHKDSQTPAELTIVFQDFRGPLFWGLCAFFLCGGLGWLLTALNHTAKTTVESSAAVLTVKNDPKAETIVHKVDEKSSALILDKHYVVCQITPLAAQALDRKTEDLLGSHFFDLLPDPNVMKAIEDGQERKLLSPFPSHPGVSALLRPLPEGTLLILEHPANVESA